VRLGEANKRARVAIRLTSDRLAAAVRAERGPAMTGGETARCGLRSSDSGQLPARLGHHVVTDLTRQQAEQQCRWRR
jgi:hypothetical protein